MKRISQPLLSIIAYPFLGFHPTVLTLLSLLFALLFFILLTSHMYTLAFLALLGSVFDAIDGYVARKTGKESLFGGFLDSTLDRVSDFLILAAFGYGGLVEFSLVLPVLATTFLVSYTRARSELSGKQMSAGIFQRTERFMLLGLGLLIFILNPTLVVANYPILQLAFILILIFNGITIAQRIFLTHRVLSK